jgi:hypothetical protein
LGLIFQAPNSGTPHRFNLPKASARQPFFSCLAAVFYDSMRLL